MVAAGHLWGETVKRTPVLVDVHGTPLRKVWDTPAGDRFRRTDG